MKTLIAAGLALFTSVLFTSCDDNPGSSTHELFDLKVWDYSDSHFLLDTIYKNSFVDFSNNQTLSQQTLDLTIDDQRFEVWIQTDPTTTGYRKASLNTDLPQIPISGFYPDSLKTPVVQAGLTNFGLVRVLSQSEYVLHKYAGYISLKINVPENYFAGVAYRREQTGVQFGTFSFDTTINATDTLILKMIKVQNLIPQYTLAWEMKMKNIYDLGITNVVGNGFEFNVNYLQNGVYSPTLPGTNNQLYFITIFGLDKYSGPWSSGPRFDYLPGITIDPENGWIIFPNLRPFYDAISEYRYNGQPIDSSFWYSQIYTQLKQNAKVYPNGQNYNMSGSVRR